MAVGLILGIFGFIKQKEIISFSQSLLVPTQTIGMEGLYTFEKLPKPILDSLSFGLTISDEKGKFTQSPIVENIDISNDNLSYLFTLKPNLKWHNSKALVASDIKLNIPGTQVSSNSDNELKITLSNQFSPALSLFSRPLFFNNTAYGLGPQKAEKITYQDGFIKSINLKNIETKKNLIYKFYSNEKDLFSAFRLGQVNEIITNQLPPDIEMWPKLKIGNNINTNQYIAIFFNTENISSKQTRQALAYATRKNNDKNLRCLTPISPNSWAYNPSVKEYNFNITRSKELFTESSLKSINLIVTHRKLLPLAENIKKDWSETLAIDVNITVSNNPKLTSYDAVLTFGQIPTDPDQYNFWHSTQTQTNISKLNNSRIDKLLEEGRLTFDQIERKKIYFDFQKYLSEESPAIFLEFPTVYTITKNN